MIVPFGGWNHVPYRSQDLIVLELDTQKTLLHEVKGQALGFRGEGQHQGARNMGGRANQLITFHWLRFA